MYIVGLWVQNGFQYRIRLGPHEQGFNEPRLEMFSLLFLEY